VRVLANSLLSLCFTNSRARGCAYPATDVGAADGLLAHDGVDEQRAQHAVEADEAEAVGTAAEGLLVVAAADVGDGAGGGGCAGWGGGHAEREGEEGHDGLGELHGGGFGV